MRCFCVVQKQKGVADAVIEAHKSTSTLHYHQVQHASVTPHIQYTRKGRPTPETPIKAIRWHVHASVVPDPAKITHRQQRKACFVLETPIPDTALRG